MSKSQETVKIDALGLCALAIDAIQKQGTPAHAKAVRLLKDAKKLWRKKAIKKCPHCGKPL